MSDQSEDLEVLCSESLESHVLDSLLGGYFSVQMLRKRRRKVHINAVLSRYTETEYETKKRGINIL